MEPCENCTCQLAEIDFDGSEIELPRNMDLERDVRDYILNHADLDDEDTFIWKVEIFPEGVIALVDEQ